MSPHLEVHTDKGARRENQDAAAAITIAANGITAGITADGVGGNVNGKACADAVVAALKKVVSEARAHEGLPDVAERAFAAIDVDVVAAGAKLGTPEMAAAIGFVLVRGWHAVVCALGDVRVVRTRGRHAQLLNVMHRKRDERPKGSPPAPDDGNLVGAVSGHGATRAPYFSDLVALEPGDRLVIASDGPYEVVPADGIPALVRRRGGAARLVRRALDGGSRDNCSVVIITMPRRMIPQLGSIPAAVAAALLVSLGVRSSAPRESTALIPPIVLAAAPAEVMPEPAREPAPEPVVVEPPTASPPVAVVIPPEPPRKNNNAAKSKAPATPAKPAPYIDDDERDDRDDYDDRDDLDREEGAHDGRRRY